MSRKNQNKSMAHIAGTIIGWTFIFFIFYGIFYFAIYLQKRSLGIYDLEKRVERLEDNTLSTGR